MSLACVLSRAARSGLTLTGPDRRPCRQGVRNPRDLEAPRPARLWKAGCARRREDVQAARGARQGLRLEPRLPHRRALVAPMLYQFPSLDRSYTVCEDKSFPSPCASKRREKATLSSAPAERANPVVQAGHTDLLITRRRAWRRRKASRAKRHCRKTRYSAREARDGKVGCRFGPSPSRGEWPRDSRCKGKDRVCQYPT